MTTPLSSGFSRHANTSQPVSPSEPSRTLLVVDDEEWITSSIADLFRGSYQVITAQSAQEALDQLESNEVDVVISDQRMPQMTGAELFAEMVTSSPETTRILLTGFADLEAVVSAVNDGKIYCYLTKPWKPGELEATVQRAFEYHTLLREKRCLIEELRETNARLEEKVAERTVALTEKNEALEASNKVKNEFLGVAAHDLRSPLSSIRSMAELLLYDAEIQGIVASEFVGLIYTTADQMLHMVNNLLDISRIEAGKIDLNLERVELEPYLAEIEKYNQIFARRKKIHLEVRRSAESTHAVFDRERIRQVINNLLDNSFKFSQPSTTVKLDVTPTAAGTEFSVTDQGQGIRSEELGLVFGAFQRTSTRPTGDEQSTGLGLSICKQIVEIHNGKIGVESTYGQGCRFYFSLPILPVTDSADETLPAVG